MCTEALGPISIALDPTAPTYVVVSLDPLEADKHSGLFLILTALLIVGAVTAVLPLKRPLPRLVFLLCFTYCAGVSLHSWAFPVYLGELAPDTGAFELPKLMSMVAVLLSTTTVIYGCVDTSVKSKSLMSVVFFAAASLPLACLGWSFMDGSLPRHAMGIIYVATLIHAGITVSIRTSEIFENHSFSFSANKSVRGNQDKGSAVNVVVVVTSSALAFCWAIIACVGTGSVDADFGVPIASLVLACIQRGIFFDDVHPILAPILASCFWWAMSAFYHIFLKGVDDGKFNIDGYDTRQRIFLPDADVSIWTAKPIWFAYLHAGLMLVPLPVIYMSAISRKKTDSEDLIFALAVLSLLSAIAGQIWSIRFLGLVGLALGMWRCNNIGQAQRISDRLI